MTQWSRMSTTSTTSLPHCTPVWAIINCHHQQLLLHLRSGLSKSLGFAILYQNSLHAYHGLCWCSHYWNIFSLHILPIGDLIQMLSHIEETLPPTMHLPVSSEDTLLFYRYLCTHALITNREFLLLIDIPIQNHTQQLSVYKMFTLDNPQWKFHSTVQCQYPIWWSHTGWNYGSGNFTTPVQLISKS